LARCLIIGCGCRGRALAAELIGHGHAVRGTTRDCERASTIEDAGVEAFVGDPDRIATLMPALDRVTVACILLGSAVGTSDELTALHGARLEMLLTRTIDTTVRGIVYEAAGSVEAAVLEAGAARVRERCEDSRIPYVLLREDPADRDAWTRSATAAVQRTLAGGRVGPR
jgi:uncharacterized protein YbjT (DUF2867 family)